jgi:hypothetical protein
VEARLGVLEIGLYCVIGDSDGPEQARARTALDDSWVVVMDLSLRATLARVDVKSNEGERAAVMFAIRADVGALHEPVV